MRNSASAAYAHTNKSLYDLSLPDPFPNETLKIVLRFLSEHGGDLLTLSGLDLERAEALLGDSRLAALNSEDPRPLNSEEAGHTRVLIEFLMENLELLKRAYPEKARQVQKLLSNLEKKAAYSPLRVPRYAYRM